LLPGTANPDHWPDLVPIVFLAPNPIIVNYPFADLEKEDLAER